MYVNIRKMCIGTESRCTHSVHVLTTGCEQGPRRNALKADSHIACRAHAVPLRVQNVSFPFDLHGATVFDSQLPCRAPTMPFFSWPRHSRCRETACGRPASYRLLPATTRSSRKFVIRSTLISDAGGQCETKQRLSQTRKSLLFCCKDMSACIIYSTKIMITIQ